MEGWGFNANRVPSALEDDLRRGRLAAEAAGEQQWLVRVLQDFGNLSDTSVDEVDAIIDAWLVRKVGEDEAGPSRSLARTYREFLDREVDPRVTNLPGAIDGAFQRWRQQQPSR